MTGPAGERLDLIAEVFEDEPPNESATRVTLGAPVAIGGPAGGRLEPVEPGQMRDGDEVIGTPKPRPQVRGIVAVPEFPLDDDAVSIRGIGDITASAYTWQRVVTDPPLPTTPGTVIDAVVEFGDGTSPVHARLMRRADPERWLWVSDRLIGGDKYGCHDRHIQPGWRQVYPEPGGEH